VGESGAARRARVRELLAAQPRVPLALLPTPLELLPRLSRELGGPAIYVKRDDLTGLAFGGNKTRQLEFGLGDILRQAPEVLVTGANIQSNWARQSTAAAARLGIPIVLVLRNSEMQEIQGNVLLDYWLGAEIRFTSEPDMTLVMRNELDKVVAELRADGRHAVKIDPWAPAISLAYVDMLVELHEQCEAAGIAPTRIWLAAAGPTQSGLELAARLLGWQIDITGVAPLTWTGASMHRLIADTANLAAELLGVDARVAAAEVDNRDDQIGPGYARPSPESLAAMRLAARTDALLLDPVYTSKAMAGLIDAIRTGELTERDTVVFVHTGGLPAVFAYRDAILEMSQA
jgi:1-aminocyclopropane-1-carboxylate deaminase/D-cysteine desulfhydrase-like pyridoxal-dependent ACC family enzyme